MANEKLPVKFSSKVDGYTCVCDACHNIGRVIKLELPITKYFNGKRLSTNYSPYWICFNCREKLTDALIWGDENGK